MPASLADSGRGLAARISRIPGNAVADLTISHRIAALKNIKDNETCNMLTFAAMGCSRARVVVVVLTRLAFLNF